MTLSFTQTIAGKPNYFIEKIWTGLPHEVDPGYYDYTDYHFDKFRKRWYGETTEDHDVAVPPKLHTIRLDHSKRWRPGILIHPVINNRTPNRFQFAPVFPCVSVQEIEIIYSSYFGRTEPTVIVDDKVLNVKEVHKLAINDGFDSAEDFFAYFDKDFTGRIIHWTDLKY